MTLRSIRLGAAKLLIATGMAFGYHSTSYADFYIHTWENHYESKGVFHYRLNPIYFTTSSNFDSEGNKTQPSGLIQYTRFLSDLNLSYGISNDLSVYGRLSWGYVNQNSSIRLGTGYGLMDQTLGLHYRILSSTELMVDLQTQLDFPLYSNSNSEANLTPYLGDGSTDWTTGIYLTIPIAELQSHHFDLAAGAGYTYRNQGYSSAIPWSSLIRYLPSTQGFYASLGFVGTLSLQTDASLLNSRSNIGGGGSFAIGAVNPTLVQLQGLAGYQFGTKTSAYLSGAQALFGQNAPASSMIGLNLEIKFGERSKQTNFNSSASEFSQSHSGFLTYSLDSHIIKVNRRLNLVKIDKGSQDGIEMGQIFDIFIRNENDVPLQAVARAKVSSIRVNETALEITEYYTEALIEEGFLAKRVVQ